MTTEESRNRMKCGFVIAPAPGFPWRQCELQFEHEEPHKIGRFIVVVVEVPE